jgi:hypothetical protein
MGAAAGKNLQAKEEGNTTQHGKKIKEIGHVESFDNDYDDNILVEDSQSSAGSPRTGRSPKLFQHIHNRSFHESQNNSPMSRLSAVDNHSPTFNNKSHLDINTGTDKSLIEITNLDEEDDQIVDDDLSTVSKYVDEKHRKRKQVLKSKRSPISNRSSFRRREDDLSEIDEDDSTSVLSYDIGDDATLGEDEDKYDSHSNRLSKPRRNLSPSSRQQLPSNASPRFSPRKSSSNYFSSSQEQMQSPEQKSSFSGFPKIASEDKSSSTPVKTSSSRQTSSGIQSLIKESQDILQDLESMAKHTSSSAVKMKSGHDSVNLSSSLSRSQQLEGNGDYLDQKNSALIGLQRQKIWSYAHNAQLEREVQDLQRQLADLDSALGTDLNPLPSARQMKHEMEHKSAAAGTSNPSPEKKPTASTTLGNMSHRNRRVAPLQEISADASIALVSDVKAGGNSSVSSLVSGQQVAKYIKRNVANIRARASTKMQSTPTNTIYPSTSRNRQQQIVMSDDNDSDVTAGNTITSYPAASSNIASAATAHQKSIDIESADSDLEGSHSSIVEDLKLSTRSTLHRRESLTKRQASSQISQSQANRRSKLRSIGHDSSDTDNDGETTVASHSQAINALDDQASQLSSVSSMQHKPARMRPSLQVQTNSLHEVTGIQSQPASTTANGSSKIARAPRSNSGLTPTHSSGKGSHKHPTLSSGNHHVAADVMEEEPSIVEGLEPIITSYQPSSPRHSSPRALRSDQNKDVLRRLNRRQKKFQDSEGEANSASEDESSSVVTSYSFNTPKPSHVNHQPQPPALQPISEAVSHSSRQPQQAHPPRRKGRNAGGSSVIKPASSNLSDSATSVASVELQSRWHEVNLLLRRRIDSEADMQFTMAAAEAGLLYSDQLNAVAKSLNVLRGTISRWILPFDNNTRIDGQCSTPMSVLERMPDALRGKISDRQIHYLVSGANSVRQLVRIKIADDNDLEQAKQALKTSMDFFKKLQEESQVLGMTPYQLLRKLQ